MVDVKVLGDLPEDEAKRFFCGDGEGEGEGEGGRWAGLVARRQAPPLEAGTWGEVYAVCGGNAGLLNQCVGMSKQAGSSWGKGARRARLRRRARFRPAPAPARRGALTPRQAIPLCSSGQDPGHRLRKRHGRLRRQGAPPARPPPGVVGAAVQGGAALHRASPAQSINHYSL
jgi:hypothetical protein